MEEQKTSWEDLVDIQTGARFPLFMFRRVTGYRNRWLLPEHRPEEYEIRFQAVEGQGLHKLFKDKYNRKPKVFTYETTFKYKQEWNGKMLKVKSFIWQRSYRYSPKFIVIAETVSSNLDLIRLLAKTKSKSKISEISENEQRENTCGE